MTEKRFEDEPVTETKAGRLNYHHPLPITDPPHRDTNLCSECRILLDPTSSELPSHVCSDVAAISTSRWAHAAFPWADPAWLTSVPLALGRRSQDRYRGWRHVDVDRVVNPYAHVHTDAFAEWVLERVVDEATIVFIALSRREDADNWREESDPRSGGPWVYDRPLVAGIENLRSPGALEQLRSIHSWYERSFAGYPVRVGRPPGTGQFQDEAHFRIALRQAISAIQESRQRVTQENVAEAMILRRASDLRRYLRHYGISWDEIRDTLS